MQHKPDATRTPHRALARPPSRRGLAFLFLLLLLALGACRDDNTVHLPRAEPEPSEADASPIAGTIPGAFAVTPTGEATYTLPLDIPPGTAGMQPSLAITYNSGSGSGMLGVGFSLSGLSSITRCPRTRAEDGQIRAVRFDGDDALCLDGARLVPIGKSGEGTEYRTFPDSFTKVIGWKSDIPDNPALSFQVFTRTGRILEYGTSDDARVLGKQGTIRSWLLQTAADRSGNTITYRYTSRAAGDGHTLEALPSSIDYTGHEGVAPGRSITFGYIPKALSDRRTAFAGGMAIESTQALASLQMHGPGGALLREYRFAYKRGKGTFRTLLRNIKECAADGSCKPRTSFAWTGEAPGFNEVSTPLPAPRSALTAPMPIDTNGDGLDDLVLPLVPFDEAAHHEIPTTAWTIALAGGHGKSPYGAPAVAFTEAHDDPTNDPVAQQKPDLEVQPDYGTPLDYDGDGRMDILVHNVHGTAFDASPNWQVLLSTGKQGLSRKDTGIPRPLHLLDNAPRLSSPEASAHLADVNGDGTPDLIQCERDPNFGGGNAFAWTLRLWSPEGPGFETSPRAIPVLQLFRCDWALQPADLDADGKVDLVLPEISQNEILPLESHVSLSYDESSDTWEKEPIGNLGVAGATRFFLDVNGDALPDVVAIDSTTGRPSTWINTGDRKGGRFGAPVEALTGAVIGDMASLFALGAVLDANGDGRQDLLLPSIDGSGFPRWVLLQATTLLSNATFAVVETGLPFLDALSEQGVTLSNRLGPRITDADGDGMADVLFAGPGTLSVFRSTGGPQDLLLRVHDGLNGHDPMEDGDLSNLEITYGTLIDRSLTSPNTEDNFDYAAQGWFAPACAYPLRCVAGPRRVVTGYLTNNGADGLRQHRVQYRGGRFDRWGRGFLGFAQVITTDLDTKAGTLDLYGGFAPTTIGGMRAYPDAGQLHRQVRWSPNPVEGDPGRVELSLTTIEREVRKTGGGATYFSMPVQVARARRQGSFGKVAPTSLVGWLALSAEVESKPITGVTITTTGYDDYGTVLGSVTEAPGVDLSTTVSDVVVENHPASWLLGQVKHRKICSTAAGVSRCRTEDRTFDGKTGLLHTETVDGGEPTAHLSLTYDRDVFGNVHVTMADDGIEAPRVVTTTYDPSGTFPEHMENALGQVVRFGFDLGSGVMTERVDENGLSTRWEVDGFGRWVREIRPDKTEARRTLSRTREQVRWVVREAITVDGGEESTTEVDGLGRAVRRWVRGTQVGDEPAPRIVVEIGYDAQGEHIVRRTVPVDEGVPEIQRVADHYAWDPAGRLVAHTTPWKAVTRYTYDGSQVEITDPLDQKTKLTSDGLGRLVEALDPMMGTTGYTYGPFGMLATVTDPGGAITSLMRDAFGRVRTSIDPDRGMTVLDYNGFGELTSSLDMAGRSVTYHRDALGRLTSRQDEQGGGPVDVTTWSWDSAPLGSGGPLALGRLGEVKAPDGTALAYTYDALGRVSSVDRTIAGEAFSVGLSYDSFSRVSAIDYPKVDGLSAFAVENTYDPNGHLIAVTQGKTAFWKLVETDNADRIHVEAFGNGFSTTRAYDEQKERLKSLVTRKGDAPPVQDLSYEYDDKLNLKSRHDALQVQNGIESFRYDGLDRLTCATFSNAPDCPAADTYVYKPNGNLLSKPGIVGEYAYDPDHPHAVKEAGSESFVHDAVGNPVVRAGVTVDYTPFDMPRSFTLPGQNKPAVTLEYDGEQARARKVAGDETTVYVGDLYERTVNAKTGAVEHRYFVHGVERLVAVVARVPGKADEARYLHTDHLGSVETVVTGDKVEKRSYDAFGERRNPAWGGPAIDTSGGTSRGFTGHEDDIDLRLVNMRGRLYDPHLGRFLTPDPFVPSPTFGQSWNPYSYVLNNPLAFIDPSGFDGVPVNPTCGAECQIKTVYFAGGSTTISHPPNPATAQRPGMELPRPPAPPPGAGQEADQAGLGTAPGDLGVTGNSTPGVRSAPASGSFSGAMPRHNTNRQASPPGFDPTSGKSRIEIGGELLHGSARGVGQAAAEVTEIDWLRVPAGLVRSVQTAWGADDPLSGLSALFWEPGASQVDVLVERAVEGDFEGAAEAGVKVVTVGVATGVALGELGGAAVDAANAGSSGPEIKTGAAGGPSAGQRFSESVREDAFAKDPSKTCVYCGRPGTGTQVDHATPRAKGGNSTPDNAQLACPHCNASKGAGTFPKTPPADYKGPWPPPHWPNK
ncbi:MAG: FG-GAP-like repeat-containing protein [Byssovorax sp.]